MKKPLFSILLLVFGVISSGQKNSNDEKIFRIINDIAGHYNSLYIDLFSNNH